MEGFKAVFDLISAQGGESPVVVPELDEDGADARWAKLPMVSTARALLAWVGEGRDVRPDGSLLDMDLAPAAAAVGLTVLHDPGAAATHLPWDPEAGTAVATLVQLPKLDAYWNSLLRAGLLTNQQGKAVPTPVVSEALHADSGFSARGVKDLIASGKYTLSEAQAMTAEWGQRFAKAKIGGTMMFPFEDRVEMTVPMTAREFRAISAREKWGEVPPQIRLSFAREMAVPRVDPRVARYVRGFASESLATTLQLQRGLRGRVVLDNGCLRLAGKKGKAKGPLVVFHRETGIGLDAQGYLAAIDRDTGQSKGRVGEMWSWAGPNPGTQFDGLEELKAACGDGPIENVGNPESEAVFDARHR